jgi:RNA polymerase sigma-70 factor (ECF subfamily)
MRRIVMKYSKKQLSELLVVHRPEIMAVILAMVGSWSDAEEIFQDLVVTMLDRRKRPDIQGPFLPWAKGVARRRVMRFFRDRRRDAAVTYLGDLEYFGDLMLRDEERRDWELEKKALRACVEKLNPRHRNLFFLRYGEGLKGRKLAKSSGWRKGSILNTLYRLRQTLRQCIAGQLGISGAEG